MNWTRLILLVFTAALTLSPLFGDFAYAFFGSGTLNVNHGDTYKFTCSSGATHCVVMETCSVVSNLSDIFQQVLVATTPTAFIGKTTNYTARSDTPPNCTTSQAICRTGTTAGAMKGLAIVTHPTGADGSGYFFTLQCSDKNGNILPGPTVIQTEDNQNN
jgi:hypothetical protein